jgi:hypothetical protein
MRSTYRTRLLFISLLTLLAALLMAAGPSAFAAITGSLSGTIHREDGTAVAGATVTLTNEAGANTGATALTAKTDAHGAYLFTGVSPGTYVVSVAAQDFEPSSSPVVIQQDFTSSVDFELEPHRLGGVTRIIPGNVHRTDPTTAYVISATTEQETKSQPNNLYQFPGLMFGQPGVTTDPGQYPHIEGGDVNQVGFDVDGIQVNDPLDNNFETNIVTVGLKSANLYTSSADPSFGNATSGYINEVTENGKDYATGGKLFGGDIEYTNGEDHGWDYLGTKDDIGGITPNGKLDFYASTIMFRNDFPGNTQIGVLNSSFDGILKSNYYADKNDTATLFISRGTEEYDDPNATSYDDPGNRYNDYKFSSPAGTLVDTGSFDRPAEQQGYHFNYTSFKHNFNNKSFITYRFYELDGELTYHGEIDFDEYEVEQDTQHASQLDYSDQIAQNDFLHMGYQYNAESGVDRAVFLINGDAPVATYSGADPFYADNINPVHDISNTAYINNQISTAGDKVTLNTGVRMASQTTDIQQTAEPFGAGLITDINGAPGNHDAQQYVDPRVGIDVSPEKSLVVRANYGVNSEFTDSNIVADLFPEDIAGLTPTAAPGEDEAQFDYLGQGAVQFNPLVAEHSNNAELGVEDSFSESGLLTGSYDVTLATYQRKQYDLIQYNLPVWDEPVATQLTSSAGPGDFADYNRGYYNNAGFGHSSGVEFKLSKEKEKAYDWNGFASYTNEVSKATTNFDNFYEPFFYTTDPSDPNLTQAQYNALNRTEFPVNYSQRHTVAAVVDKRVTNLVEFAAFLDAGSGYPFGGAAPNNGAFESVLDGRHGGISTANQFQLSNGAEFGEVPVVLLDGSTLNPTNPIIGTTGWHYKITLNTTFHVSSSTSLFLNVDNVFDHLTPVTLAPTQQTGVIYYHPPTAQQPQGYIYYGPSAILTPIFVSVGFRTKF